MPMMSRIQQALDAQLQRAAGASAPPRLIAAMRHAVFPGGARIRPQLCLAVAQACGDDDPALTDAAAGAIELLHCASLVHDDMPCFDDAATRRGQAIGAHRLWRTARPADWRRADRPRLPDPGAGWRSPAAAARRTAADHQRAAWARRTASSPGRPGNARPAVSLQPVPARQDRRAVRGRHLRRRAGRRRRSPTLARSGRVPGRGLPGGRRHPRRAAAVGRSWASPSARTPSTAGPAPRTSWAWPAPFTCFDRLMQNAIDSVPDCPSRAVMRAMVWRESERLMPQSTCERAVLEGRIASAPAPLQIAA